MALHVGDIVREGARRTVGRNSLGLIGAFLLVRLASAVASETLLRANRRVLTGLGGGGPADALAGVGGPTPLALALPLPAALVLVAALAVLAEAVRIVAVRTLVRGATDRLPRAVLRRRIGWATLNGMIGGVVVGVLIAVGLVVLIAPGVFLAVVFLFVRGEVAVADKNVIDAMAGSWDLTSGHRVELLALVLVLVAAGVAGALPSVVLGAVDPLLGALSGALAGAVTTVFAVAVTARAYVQLRAARPHREAPDPA
ncbi:MAG: hypothetical protein ABEI39_04115 [Halobacteriales archaeon]